MYKITCFLYVISDLLITQIWYLSKKILEVQVFRDKNKTGY